MAKEKFGLEKKCERICLKYKVKKKRVDQSYYEIEDAKYCSDCVSFVQWQGKFCPCCGGRLRSRPRNPTGIDKYRKFKKVVYQ